MSTYIDTNTTASMAAFNLNNNNNSLSNDIEQLSTGLRINSPSDDPAGLAVSENMDAQLSGLNQATQNTSDADNMTKTAEGALSQVQNLLISMRQLAVQASNLGVNDSTDVQADQTQIASAIQSLNQISADTQFGTKYLLNGSSTAATTTSTGSAVYNGTTSDFSVLQQGAWSTTGAASGTLAAGTLNNISATAATATTINSSAVVPETGQSAYASTDYFEGALTINGTQYNIGGSGDNQTLAQLNQTISASGYTATVASNGEITLTSATTGAPASAQSATFASLGTYANATTTTQKGSYTDPAANTGGTNVVATAGAAAVSAADATVTTASGSATITQAGSLSGTLSLTGTLVLNGHSITDAEVTANAGGDTLADWNTYIQSSTGLATSANNTADGTNYANWSLAIDDATGAITFADGTAANDAAPTIDADGLTVTDSQSTADVATYAASSATGTAGAVASSATADTVVGYHNGAYASTDTFGGSFVIDGSTISLTGTNNNLAAIQTALTQAGVGYTVSQNTTTGDLTFTDNTTGQAALTGTNLSNLQTYAVGSTIATGGYTAALQGQDAQASFTDSNGSTVETSSSSVTSGTQTSFYFSNGLALSISNMPTSGSTSVNGSITATAGTSTTGSDLEFQIGANEGQTVSLSIGSIAADQLGTNAPTYTDADGNSQTVLTNNVADLNVTTFKGAQDAIAVIDQAISQVSTIQANLGAFDSNVLQSQEQSLGTATTNLQAAQATITDANMASTVVDYTKDSILVQSATSALAYANQMPQDILKLLQ